MAYSPCNFMFLRFVVELKALEAGSFGWCKLQTTYVI